MRESALLKREISEEGDNKQIWVRGRTESFTHGGSLPYSQQKYTGVHLQMRESKFTSFPAIYEVVFHLIEIFRIGLSSSREDL
jgi:hypothetical protein